jgi:5-methylcytosine-specific restriction endonuclease McrA
MPNAPPHPCVVCGRLVTGGPRCARHQRPSSTARGYGGAWPAVARAWLLRYPWCGQRRDGRLYTAHSACARRRQRIRAAVVDHIRPLPFGSRLDPDNLQSLCVSCNTRKGGSGRAR